MIFLKVREASGRTAKMSLLHKANNVEKEVMRRCYDRSLTYGVKFDIPYEKYNLGTMSIEGFQILDKLANRTITGDLARDIVEDYSRTWGDLIKYICNKDLSCGISETTILKVFPTLFPAFKVQLALDSAKRTVDLPVYVEKKFDGVRCVAIIKRKGVTLHTRNGKRINCPQLEELLHVYTYEIVLDGELIEADGKVADRTSVSGRVNSAIKGGMLTMRGLTYMVFDCIPYECFANNKVYDKTYFGRQGDLNLWEGNYRHHWVFKDVKADCPYEAVKVTDSHRYDSYESIQDEFKRVLNKGYEGLMLKNPKGVYNYKRSADWIKMKEIKEARLYCTAALAGDIGTKYQNSIGRLLLTGEVEGKPIEVKVGSGLSDKEREFEDDAFVGKYVVVKYNSVIKDSTTSKWSLFLPRYVRTL